MLLNDKSNEDILRSMLNKEINLLGKVLLNDNIKIEAHIIIEITNAANFINFI